MWKQHELWDGTYDIHDLFNINRILDVIEENKQRAAMAVQEQMHRR